AGTASSDALTPGDLAPPDGVPASAFPVDRAAVEDVLLHTGLFEPVASGGYRPIHAALGEFLAARVLHVEKTRPGAALRLLSQPGGGLLPQHRQVAGWLAALDPVFFEALAEAEPYTALLYVPDPAPEQRPALLDGLFAAFDQGALTFFELGFERLKSLDHPDLDDQLRETLHDTSPSVEARILPLHVVLRIERVSLLPDLLQIANDTGLSARIRALAARAVGRFGAAEDYRALLPLARVSRREDPTRVITDEVREVLFPDLITVQDL